MTGLIGTLLTNRMFYEVLNQRKADGVDSKIAYHRAVPSLLCCVTSTPMISPQVKKLLGLYMQTIYA